MADEILTIREVAELLKINEKTAYKLASAGKIPGFKVGGSWRFERQEIANWIKRKVEEQQGGGPRVIIQYDAKSLARKLGVSRPALILANAKEGRAQP
jgi:excisionase family DNA binding protein